MRLLAGKWFDRRRIISQLACGYGHQYDHLQINCHVDRGYLGLFVGLIDANAVNLALPAIRTDLGGGISGAQWTIDAYNVAFAAVLLTSGSLGDRFGRRALLRFGLATFVVASLGCAPALSLPVLLAARAVQGIAPD